MTEHKHIETAVFAAGCFWNVEATFRKVDGVIDAEVGYTGGQIPHPTYEEVCSNGTGHAESLRITFDPDKVSYNDLLKIFWDNHNPTTLNRQGPDVGSQYRSVIFYMSEEQRNEAEASKKALAESGKWKDPIVTQIVPATDFYRAEEYHQRYLEKHGLRG